MRARGMLLSAGVAVAVVVGVYLGIVAGGSFALAQSFPDHLIRIIVPYPPGGPADVAGRLVTQAMTARLGQNVIIENQPGAGGRTGA